MDIDTEICHPSSPKCCKLLIESTLNVGETLVIAESELNCVIINLNESKDFTIELEMKNGNKRKDWIGEKISLHGNTQCNSGIRYERGK